MSSRYILECDGVSNANKDDYDDNNSNSSDIVTLLSSLLLLAITTNVRINNQRNNENEINS